MFLVRVRDLRVLMYFTLNLLKVLVASAEKCKNEQLVTRISGYVYIDYSYHGTNEGYRLYELSCYTNSYESTSKTTYVLALSATARAPPWLQLAAAL